MKSRGLQLEVGAWLIKVLAIYWLRAKGQVSVLGRRAMSVTVFVHDDDDARPAQLQQWVYQS